MNLLDNKQTFLFSPPVGNLSKTASVISFADDHGVSCPVTCEVRDITETWDMSSQLRLKSDDSWDRGQVVIILLLLYMHKHIVAIMFRPGIVEI